MTDTKVLSADNDLEQLKQANERQEDEIFILHKTIEDLEEKVKCYKEQLSSKDYIVSNLETKFTDTIASHNEQIKSKDEMIATVKNEFKMLEKKLGDFKSTEDSLIDKHKEANKSEIKTLLETLEMKEKEIQRLKEVR